MQSNNRPKTISLIATLVIAAAFFLFLYFCPVLVAGKPEPVKKGEVELLVEEVPEEYVEFLEPRPTDPGSAPAPAHLDEPKVTQSMPSPEAGTDLTNSGKAGDKPPVVQQTQPSPVQQQKNDPKANPGQAEQPKADEQAEVRRKAENDVAGKLNKKGKSNAYTSDTADKGNSGLNTPATGSAVVAGLQGTGWNIPSYRPVQSPVVGSIQATVKIDATGKVVSVVITGGDPPAATNPTVRAAVERELKSRKFSRSSYTDAQPATAYITYRFK